MEYVCLSFSESVYFLFRFINKFIVAAVYNSHIQWIEQHFLFIFSPPKHYNAKNGIRIYYGSYEIPVTEYKIKSHQREIFAEEKSMNNRANKEKKIYNKNNNTYYRP